MKYGIFQLGLAWSLCVVGPSWAGVEFVSERIELRVEPLAEQAVAFFEFTNTGADSVRILSVETGCDCLSATADVAEVPAGETGKIRAVYEIENLVGDVEKAMVLHTTDPNRPEIRLGIAVVVPSLVVLEPKMTEWVLGEAGVTKEILFKVTGAEPIVIRQAVSSQFDYKVELFEVTAGREYRMRVTPPANLVPTVGAVKITTDHPHPKYQRMMAFFTVNRPEVK